MNYTIFSTNGEYRRNIKGGFLVEDIFEDEVYVGGEFNTAHWLDVDTYTVHEKESVEFVYNSAVAAGEVCTITLAAFEGISLRHVNGVVYELTDTVVNFSSPEPGVYALYFFGPKYLETEVIINVT